MANRTSVLFTCTESFKEALGTYAQQNKVSLSIVIREAVARQIGYDLANEETTDGRKKYASKEDRLEAQKKRQRLERREVTKLLEALAHEQHLADVGILTESLKKTGIADVE